MSTVSATATATARADVVARQWVDALARQDFSALAQLYAPTARLTVHVPGWDTVLEGQEVVPQVVAFFDYLDFAVEDSEIVGERDGGRAALHADLTWTDRETGAPCACFQSHHLTVIGGRIAQQWMYCAGVRVAE